MNHEASDISFAVANCPKCGVALIHQRFVGDTLETACLGCDSACDDTTVRWLSSDEVQDIGYFVDGYEKRDGKRGCRGGACGVQQPSE